MTTSSQRGATLIELMVGMIVSGLVLGTAIPSLSTALGAGQLQGATRSTLSYVRAARAMAVSKNIQARLVVSGDGRRLSTEVLPASGIWSPRGTPLVLDGATVSMTPSAGALRFNREGTATSAVTVTVRSSRGDTRTITVSPVGLVEAS